MSGWTAAEIAGLDQEHAAAQECLDRWVKTVRGGLERLDVHQVAMALDVKLSTGTRDDLEALLNVALIRLARCGCKR